jgi:LysR family transcriptional regulator, glycine cleavage system transcriptional activator
MAHSGERRLNYRGYFCRSGRSKGSVFWSSISTMRDLPLNALRAFAAVHAHGGVRPAARALGIAHSAVSRHVAELERWLGVALTEPGSAGRHGKMLNPAGQSLGRAAQAALEDIASAAAALREARSPNSVTLSTTASVASRWLLPRVGALERKHPRIELSIVVTQKLEDFETRAFDLSIRMGRGPWPDLRCEALMDDALYPVMSPSLWERARRPAQPEDLRGLKLIHDRDPNASWAAWRDVHGPKNLDIRGGVRYTSSDLVLRGAALGQGVALARHRLAYDDLAAGTLMRPFGDLRVDLPKAYWILISSHSLGRAAVKTLVHWLNEQAAEPMP